MATVVEQTPLERAARAINPFVWGDGPDREAYQRDAMEKARAVLQAIREPSTAMLDAGEYDDSGPPGEGVWFGGHKLEESWQRMIDAALAD